MELGTYTDGRPLTYDERTGGMAIGGVPVTIEQVLEYDRHGQISWVSVEVWAWAHGRTPAPSTPVPVAGWSDPAPAATQVPPTPTSQAAWAARPERSKGATVGIVVGILVAAILLGVGGAFVYRAVTEKEPATTPTTSSSAATPAATAATAAPAAEADPGTSDLVTGSEASDVVNEFLTLRADGDIEGSKALCTSSLLEGPDGVFVDDEYWNPDSWEITKLTADEMYIHVTSMGQWPSGREATIFSVYREPESGEVLIDGFLDPQEFPELVTP